MEPDSPFRHWAEAAACAHLEAKGWVLIARNYRLELGEIDLVMRAGRTLVFIEVRQRATERFGGAAGSIDRRKLERLRRAAEHFALRHFAGADVDMRLDAVLVRGRRGACTLTHLEGVG